MKRSKQAANFKNEIYEQFARIGKAVSNSKRLEILDLLSQGPRTVESLAKGIRQSVANTSQHLQILRTSRMVSAEKNGLFVYYSLADETVGDFYISLRRLAEKRLAEVNQVTQKFLEDHGVTDRIEKTEILHKIENGDITVLDLRSETEFELGHLPNAISIPAKELENRLSEIPKDKEVAIYCRGPYCVIAIEATQLLKEKGFTAYRIEDGVPEWKAMGLKVETDFNN